MVHGSSYKHSALWATLLLGMASCGEARPQPAQPPSDAPDEPASRFDPSAAGSIEGRVTWTGDIPTVPPLVSWPNWSSEIGTDKVLRDNPNAPRIDPRTRGVENAVVFLRGVEPTQARPWDHPAVQVEQRDYRLRVLQGETDSSFGFVRRGASVAMVSRQEVFHSLRTDGAAFFTLVFPDRDQPRTRALPHKGIVELTSGIDYFWMRAYLFVDDHPYYARTDAEGRFKIQQVPPGRYQAVCWMPELARGPARARSRIRVDRAPDLPRTVGADANRDPRPGGRRASAVVHPFNAVIPLPLSAITFSRPACGAWPERRARTLSSCA